MSAILSEAAASLRSASQMLSEAGARLARLDPGASASAAVGGGRLNEIAEQLLVLCRSALDARVREAAAHGARLDDAAEAVRRTAEGYAVAEESARRRRPEVS